MGIADIFGFGKKEPFRAPREVSQLLTRIASENKENFPHRERYQELVEDAENAYRILDTIVAQKKYAEEAIKLQQDIKQKLAALGARIKKNFVEGKKEISPDYLEKESDYLARKWMRMEAKNIYMEFLHAQELIIGCCRLARTEKKDAIDSAASQAQRALSILRKNYFKPFGQDREILGIRETVQTRVAELVAVFEEHKARLEEAGLREQLEPIVSNLNTVAKELSAP
jgi:hypothetical protein